MAAGFSNSFGMHSPAQVMFDDFHYASVDDPDFHGFNWTVKEGAGSPGASGSIWSGKNVLFIDDSADSGNKLLRLSAITDGTPSGTSQAEILHQLKYFEGTYAARVRFTDVPLQGLKSDKVNETFFTISPLRFNNDPLYSECDFEYLCSGGWGVTGPTMWTTTWNTYQVTPEFAKDNVYDYINSSHSGWHDLLFTVCDGYVKYYMDGTSVSSHGGKYYPRTDMLISFNIWILGEEGALLPDKTVRTYIMDVDWVFHAKNSVLSISEVKHLVDRYRFDSIRRIDTIGI